MGTQIVITRVVIFLTALSILGSGIYGVKNFPSEQGLPFLLGALTLGGGFLICGLFSIKQAWHGVIGAGILALLGFGRGLVNLPSFAQFMVGNHERGSIAIFEFFTMIACAMVLVNVTRILVSERARKMRE